MDAVEPNVFRVKQPQRAPTDTPKDTFPQGGPNHPRLVCTTNDADNDERRRMATDGRLLTDGRRTDDDVRRRTDLGFWA